MFTRRIRERSLQVLLLWSGLVLTAHGGLSQELIEIPGGIATVRTLLRLGPVEEAAFVAQLNQVLLEDVRNDGDWRKIDARARLVTYLEVVQEVKQLFPHGVRLADIEDHRQLAALAETFGYKAKKKGKAVLLELREGDRWLQRRLICKSLGWDMGEIAQRLNAGVPVVLELPTQMVPSPLPPSQLSTLADRQITAGTALLSITKDQRLSLVLEGMRRVSPESALVLRDNCLEWLARDAAVAFYRYAASLEIRGGSLVIPGGEQAAADWQRLVGVSPAQPVPFLHRLLTGDRGRSAYFWNALFFREQEVARFYLMADAGTGNGETFVSALTRRLDRPAGVMRYDQARGNEVAFDACARSLRLSRDGASIALPGTPGLWETAVRLLEAPTDRRELAHLAQRARSKETTVNRLLLEVLAGEISVGGYARPVLPRIMRASWMFDGAEALLTPENVLLCALVSETAPIALRPLDRFTLSDPEVVTTYLRAVVHLSTLSASTDHHLVIESFQGGVELLRILAQTGRADAPALERLLGEWTQLYVSAQSPEDVAGQTLSWLARLARILPSPPDDAVGRGPYERALLAAMIARDDPERFNWRGLDYQGWRGRDLAEKMTAHWQHQQIGSLDEVVGIADAVAQTRAACTSTSPEAASLASGLAKLVSALPVPTFSPALTNEELERRFLPMDRQRCVALVRRVSSQRDTRKLPKLAATVDEAASLLLEDLRPVLLMPAYLEAMGEHDNALLRDPNLVRKHTATVDLSGRRPGDTPWAPTQLVTAAQSSFGSHFAGHLAGVAAGMYEFVGKDLDANPIARIPDALRDQLWYRNAITTAWSSISPATSRLTATLMAWGDRAVRATAMDPGNNQLAEVCREVVPAARLHRAQNRSELPRLSSPGELLSLGLLLVERQLVDLVAEDDERLSPEQDGRQLGQRLAIVGAPTPTINGRGRPWIGRWPPYEELENEGPTELLIERELVDLRLKVIEYLGRHELPGEVGADLLPMVITRARSELVADTERDWEGFLLWLEAMDESYFDERMRECFADGRFVAELF